MDEDTWIELLHERMPPLHRAVSRRVGADRALAEDVTQEAWLRAVAAWSRDGLPDDPGAWLWTVAANLLRNHFRRVAASTDVDLDGQPARGPEDALSDEERQRAERAAAIQRGMARLKPDVAELIGARHLDGLSLEELATTRGLSVRAVEGRLRRGRAALARHVDPRLLDS